MDRRTFLQTAAVTGLTASAGCSGLLSSRRSTTEHPRGDWRQAAGGPGNTATAPQAQGTAVSWTTALPDRPATPPVVANGVAVVGTAAGSVIAVDLETGSEQWRRETSGVQGAPAIVDEWVVVPADDGRIDRFSLSDGNEAKPMAVGASLQSAISVAGSHAYVVSTPGKLAAVHVADWRIEWTVPLPTLGVGTPAITEDRVLVSGSRPDESGSVVAVDRTTGEEVWRVQTEDELGGTPVATDSDIVVAGAPSNQIQDSSSEEQPDPAGLFWLDPETGAVRRSETIQAPIWDHCSVRSLAATREGVTLTGCNSLVHYGPDGPVWSASMAQGVTTRPLVTPEGVLVGDSDGQFWLVENQQQTRLFSVDGIPATPAVLDRGLVVPAGRTLVGLA